MRSTVQSSQNCSHVFVTTAWPSTITIHWQVVSLRAGIIVTIRTTRSKLGKSSSLPLSHSLFSSPPRFVLASLSRLLRRGFSLRVFTSHARSRFDPNRWQGKSYRTRYWNEPYFDALDVLRPVAEKHGLTVAECALRWMTNHSKLRRENGDAVIIGASSTQHIEQNLVDLEKGSLPEEVVKALDQGWERVKGISGRYWH